MNDLKKVIGNLQIIEWNNQRVITTEQLAQVYGTETDNIKHNFRNNKNRFIENEHYFYLEGDSLSKFKNLVNDSRLVNKHAPRLYLWTHKGASRHCKILDSNQAWKQFDILEENYFNPKPITPQTYKEALLALIAKEEERERLQAENKTLQLTADKYEGQTKTVGLYKIGEIAEELGTTAIILNRFLAERRVQYKPNGSRTWRLYGDYVKERLAFPRLVKLDNGFELPLLLWTPKGRDFIFDLIERELPEWYA
jgi:phage antirepressor YoqD-like protein